MKHTKKSAMGIIPLLLVAFFLSLFSNIKAQAYSFTIDFKNGFYWSSFPIKMAKFAPIASDSALLERISNEAIEEWESVIGKDIWELSPVQSNTGYTGNFIRWSDNFGADTGFDPSRTLAVTIRYNQGTFFQQTVIILNGGISYLRQNWGNSLKTTILHEVGHTLGLDHSGDTQAVMAASLGAVSVLQSDDIAGANALIDETIRRQSTGFVSPFAAREEKVAACGSIEDFASRSGGPGGGATSNFLGSILFGLLAILGMGSFGNRRKQKALIRY